MTDRISFEQFYQATGQAIAAWQQLEDAICDVFSRTVICSIAGTMLKKPKSIRVVGEIFYSSTNFRANLRMVTNAIEATVTDAEIIAEWNAINNQSLNLYKRRNTIAHGHVWGNEHHGAMDVMPSPFNPSARKRLNYVQVCASERSFKRIAERARALAIRINEHLVQTSGLKPIPPA